MQENFLILEEKSLSEVGKVYPESISDKNLISSDITENKEHKRNKLGVYFLVTLSAFIFFASFLLCDLGYKVAKCEKDNIPSIILSGLLGGNADDYDISLTDLLVSSFYGVSKEGATSILPVASDKSKEKDYVNDNKPQVIPSEDEKTPQESLATETEKEIDDDIPRFNILKMDLSRRDLGEYYIGNETGYTPDVVSLLKKESGIPVYNKTGYEPLVLILHTHGTEAYTEEGVDYYIDDGRDISRTTDKSKNVIAIGALMSEILNSEGIPTLHCEIMHDEKSYQDSYIRAAESIKEYLAKYPSIKYIFDVHRDAILTSDGSLVKTHTSIDGKGTAQLMTVVGSNYKGADFDNWQDNLSLALKLKAKLDKKYPGLSRPVYLRGAAYNLQYTEGSLLLEVGSSGNTLSEAKTAAEYLARALAEIIKGK